MTSRAPVCGLRAVQFWRRGFRGRTRQGSATRWTPSPSRPLERSWKSSWNKTKSGWTVNNGRKASEKVTFAGNNEVYCLKQNNSCNLHKLQWATPLIDSLLFDIWRRKGSALLPLNVTRLNSNNRRVFHALILANELRLCLWCHCFDDVRKDTNKWHMLFAEKDAMYRFWNTYQNNIISWRVPQTFLFIEGNHTLLALWYLYF